MYKNKLSYMLQRILLGAILLVTAACSEESDLLKMGADEGEVSFSLVRFNSYGITELNEIATVKITLEKEGVRMVLPSMAMNGSIDSVSTAPFCLKEGKYSIVEYKAFNASAAQILVCEPSKHNEFIVERGQRNNFIMPLIVHDKIDKNNVLNTLYSICREAFGDDRSLWPKTWNTETDLAEWENIEFDLADDGSVNYIVALTLDSKFGPMKKLSPAIVNFPTLESLIIRDNDFEEFPYNMGEMNVKVMQIINTNLSSFPESVNKLTLHGLSLDGNKFTSFPEFLANQPYLRDLTIRNEQIDEIPAWIGDLGNLVSLSLTNLNITSIPNVFDRLYRISTLDISHNKALSTLPATIGMESYGNQSSYMRGLVAEGCGFTSIPAEIQNDKFRTVVLSDNKITAVEAAQLEAMTSLSTLYLSGNKLSAFPNVTLPAMEMLVLIDCGLTADQVNRDGMPNLYTTLKDINTGEEKTYDFLFFTQDQFESIFKGYEVIK
ncbi:MAG: leucine-rich repeat domain-containing protein [Bacteroidales bacterium]